VRSVQRAIKMNTAERHNFLSVPKSEQQAREGTGMVELSLQVNGRNVSGQAEPQTLLVDFLRKQLSLTGAHVGCDTSQCGSCVVLVDGNSVKSCTMLAVQAQGAKVTTVEGLSAGAELHPVQAAFRETHALQCGFCTPGMIMSTVDLLAKNPDPSEAEIRSWLKGNICRCTGYHNIIRAVQLAAGQMRTSAAA
jgi:aerobic carbon-monoxide dehydrogenase small subunit